MGTQFIAEVSSNHHRDIERCFQFIDVAAASGCDAVKFQLFKIDQMFAPEILEKSEMHRNRKQWELPLDFLPALAERCKQKNIAFSCTPFYLQAVEELAPHVDFFKIASYELMWDDLIQACAASNKPLVLSVGMASLEEIDHAVNVARKHGCDDLTLLHCVSAYPTPPKECNLAVIQSLKTRYQCRVGWSDHSVKPGVIQRAVHRWNAQSIEFHLDLDGQGEEYAAGHCWLPHQIQAVIEDIHLSWLADGSSEKTTTASELADREWRADPSDGLRPLVHIRREFRA
jgi:N-acetylneuraminate synthase